MKRYTELALASFTGLILLMVFISLRADWRAVSAADRAATSHETADEETKGAEPGFLHPVIIRQPAGPPQIELATVDPQGRSGRVACSTCHSLRQPNLKINSAAALDEFHQGLEFNHGRLTCYACHHPDDSDALRLADGSRLEYVDVMTLCAQCHSGQATAFTHGAHGGMNGYWDRSRGPQSKNNCIDCHDPHAPSYPKMVVGFKPRDRFLAAGVEHQHDD